MVWRSLVLSLANLFATITLVFKGAQMNYKHILSMIDSELFETTLCRELEAISFNELPVKRSDLAGCKRKALLIKKFEQDQSITLRVGMNFYMAKSGAERTGIASLDGDKKDYCEFELKITRASGDATISLLK